MEGTGTRVGTEVPYLSNVRSYVLPPKCSSTVCCPLCIYLVSVGSWTLHTEVFSKTKRCWSSELADGLTAEHKLNLGMKPELSSTETDCGLSVSLTDPQVDKDDR